MNSQVLQTTLVLLLVPMLIPNRGLLVLLRGLKWRRLEFGEGLRCPAAPSSSGTSRLADPAVGHSTPPYSTETLVVTPLAMQLPGGPEVPIVESGSTSSSFATSMRDNSIGGPFRDAGSAEEESEGSLEIILVDSPSDEGFGFRSSNLGGFGRFRTRVPEAFVNGGACSPPIVTPSLREVLGGWTVLVLDCPCFVMCRGLALIQRRVQHILLAL